ncbi:hypothetical protein AA103196_0937 [Ameyamaea chiangmaiensis NBRC 103196]|uniref:Uncharacterized protein n=1 Tax=Ameyamaea chiangmaiensis TaxID=442969 RepID=A0A850P4X6_9PROT|nr:hypothetical protein [Ameyamaea chiangmaiensis]MBS4076238.1 hypothetical protein [Ameyamaea chiangmaiensis]NVN39695.1 hypothetical protein [Ameyamaea chiangmaiensis]GBQ64671.1 hypothetical protein AA103196_0937 [Ameyamaea chiangmaiensis NBRC 103196]
MSESLFAPEGGWVVRILDLSGASDDNVTEEIKGFPDLFHANAFARAYVRDSVERCRAATGGVDVLNAWYAYGEDAEVKDAGENGWQSGSEIAAFVGTVATPMERDWRSLDPRSEHDDEDED